VEVATLKITGFNELQRTMDELAKFGADLDGEIAQVTFDPTDPTSIEAAIQEVADAVDAKAKSYPSNEMVQNLAEQAKESLREQVLERAAAARLEGEKE
jgi:tRNA threonylcarbamoyladenosine modification (KEOPS) complex Cgi121 subunit